MWLFLSRRLRRWLFVTVAVPVLSAGARRLGAELERRRGSTRLSRGLTVAGSWFTPEPDTRRPGRFRSLRARRRR